MQATSSLSTAWKELPKEVRQHLPANSNLFAKLQTTEITSKNASVFVSLAREVIHELHAQSATFCLDKKVTHILLANVDSTLRKVCACNPNQPGVKELLSNVDILCDKDYDNPNFP